MKDSKILGVVFVLALILAACAPAPTQPPATLPPTEPSIEPSLTEAPATTEPAMTDTQAADTPSVETPTLSVPVTGETTIMVSQSTDFGPILVDGNGMSLYLFMADTQNSGTSTCGDDDGCATEWPPLLCGATTGISNDNTNTNANTNSNTNTNTNANTNTNTNSNTNTNTNTNSNTNTNANSNSNTNTSGTTAAADCSLESVAGEGVDATLVGTITRDDGTTQLTYNGWPLYLFEEDTAAGDTNGQGLEEFGGLWFLVTPEGEAVQQ